MRRFIDTFAGKALCHLAAMALVLPTVTLAVTARAEAQVTQLPSWAVTEFKDLKGNASLKYGVAAADAVAGELAKTNKYDVVSQDSVKRSIETLGLTSPLEGLVNLQRVGQDVRAGTIVQGEILDYRVKAVGGGKQAIVAVRLVAYDVASGAPVNGALEKGESTIRGNNATNDVLIKDAIGQAAAVAVRTMQGQLSPTGTILNTTNERALINQGARAGFRGGDTVIITRAGIQVATGHLGDVEPDQSEVTIERRANGSGAGSSVAPGDHVRTVFNPPALPAAGLSVFTDKDNINVKRSGRRGSPNNATLISALLVLGLVAVLIGSGGNGNSTEAGNATAEATLDTDGVSPGVRISFTTNGFFKGNNGNGPQTFQIYRPTDVAGANPVIVVSAFGPRQIIDATDSPRAPTTAYFTSPVVSGNTCVQTPTNASFTAAQAPPVVPGRPYFYQVEAVYTVSQRDLPDSGSAGSTAGGTTATGGSTASTGTTGTTATGGATTGTTGTTGTTATTSGTTATTGTTGTTAGTSAGTTATTSGDVLCYFRSGRTTTGQATPLFRPVLTAPTNNTSISTAQAQQNFTFTFTQGSNSIFTPQFVLEFSDDPNFSKSRTISIANTTTPGVLSFNVNTLGSNFTGKKLPSGATLATAASVFFRVGARNAADKPGPVPENGDKSRRYIYSTSRFFTRAANPPGTPGG